MEGAPDGLLFEAEIMTAIEEAAFLKLALAVIISGSAEMRPTSEFPPLLDRFARGQG